MKDGIRPNHHPQGGTVIPGTLATGFRDLDDHDSARLGVIHGTLATMLIGGSNILSISSVGRVPVAWTRPAHAVAGPWVTFIG